MKYAQLIIPTTLWWFFLVFAWASFVAVAKKAYGTGSQCEKVMFKPRWMEESMPGIALQTHFHTHTHYQKNYPKQFSLILSRFFMSIEYFLKQTAQ